MSATGPAYPIPGHLQADVEIALERIPDRGTTVFHLRRLFGRIYAEGHAAGWSAAQYELHYDRNAPKVDA